MAGCLFSVPFDFLVCVDWLPISKIPLLMYHSTIGSMECPTSVVSGAPSTLSALPLAY